MNLLKHKAVFSLFIVTATVVLFFLVFKISYNNKIYPGAAIAGIKVAGMSPSSANALLEEELKQFEKQEFTLNLKDKTVNLTPVRLGFQVDIKTSVDNAFHLGHKSNPVADIIALVKLIINKGDQSLVYTIHEDTLRNAIQEHFGEFETKAENATLKYNKDDFVLVKSKTGQIINQSKLRVQLEDNFNAIKTQNIRLALTEDMPQITDNETDTAYNQAYWILDDGVTLTYEPVPSTANADKKVSASKEKLWKIPENQLKSWIKFVPITEERSSNNTILGIEIDKEKVKSYLETLAPEVNQQPVNARLTIGEDGKVKVFTLSQEGRELKLDESADIISEKLVKGEKQMNIIVQVAQPEVTTDTINNLGIATLIAKGESNFKGSPKNRRHNIKVGTEKFSGILVKPSEEFSFNTILGEVGPEQGYLPELVIKQNKTIPEYGGGLCQVSTTVFRAALNAGLPITERKSHAYVVRYYGTPGMDATIYPPHPDLRFKNDTPAHILIQPKLKGDDLTFEFYGTSDGRESKLIGPTVYDRQPNGAMKTVLYREIYKDGALLTKDTFRSNYASPENYPKTPFD